MPALDRNILAAACRDIYKLAGENYMLPPLTRQAGEAASQHVFKHRFGECEICLYVSLDETRADRNAYPDAGLPIKFRAELQDVPGAAPAVELIGHEKYEMARAFLLGAILPISLDKTGDGATFRLSLQLASTYSVDCGEVTDVNDCRVSNEICYSVSEAIYKRSDMLFESRQASLDVWASRAAQDLFGDAPPSPEMLWPIAAPQVSQSEVSQPEVRQPAVRQLELARRAVKTVKARGWFPRYAIAASLVLAIGGAAGLSSLSSMLDESRALRVTETAPPVAVLSIVELPAQPDPAAAEFAQRETRPEPAPAVPDTIKVVALPLAVVNLAVGSRTDLETPAPAADPKRASAAKPVPPAPGKAAEARRNAASASWPGNFFAAFSPAQSKAQKPKAKPRSAVANRSAPTLTRVIRDIERIPYRIASLIKT